MRDVFVNHRMASVAAATLSALSYAFAEKDGMRARLLYQPHYGETGEGDHLGADIPARGTTVVQTIW